MSAFGSSADRGPAPWTLRRRLVVGIAGVVAVVLLGTGLLSIAVLSTSTNTVADTQLTASLSALSRSVDKYRGVPAVGGHGGGVAKSFVDFVGHGRGTVIAVVADAVVADSALFSDTGAVVLSPDAIEAIELAFTDLADGENRSLELAGLGTYRVATVVNDGELLVAGVPLEAAEMALLHQALAIAVATVLALAGTMLGTILVVRLALRPLARVVDTAVEVTALPLDVGDHGISTRLTSADTDPRTETGKVGEALNQLLDHVDTALSVRAATDRRMRRFVTDASHELRTPLAAIQGYAELTRQDSAELPEITEYSLARIESEARRMSSLVSDLLLLARLDEGQDLNVEDVDLADLLLTAVNDARASAPSHNWVTEVPDTAVIVRGDRERLHQLVANLLSNARVHTPPASTVTARLRVGSPGLPVQLSVEDDGTGITDELLPAVFERFARGDASRAQGSGGTRSTGLGLAIALSIAEAHGGTIRVRSSSAGTAFTVTLPPSIPRAPSREL